MCMCVGVGVGVGVCVCVSFVLGFSVNIMYSKFSCVTVLSSVTSFSM